MTTQGQLGLGSGELYWSSGTKSTQDAPIVAGSHYCPDIQGWFDSNGDFREDEATSSCFNIQTSGSAHLAADDCVDFTGAGSAQILFFPRACSVASFVSDALPFNVVAPEDVELRFDAMWLREDAGTLRTARPLPAGTFPSRETEIAVPPGIDVVLGGGLFERNTGAFASWNHEAFTIVPTAGNPVLPPFSSDPEIDVLLSAQPVGTVRMVEGDAVSFEYRASGVEFTSSATIGVSSEAQAASLELVAFYGDTFNDYGPRSVHAIVEDQLGRRVVGAPVVWTVQGADVLEAVPPGPDGELAPLFSPGDRIELESDCGQDRVCSGRVLAAYGNLRAAIELEWDSRDAPDGDSANDEGGGWGDDDDDDSAGADEDDQSGLFDFGGCACSSNKSQGGAPWLVLLGVLLAGLRRRRVA